MKTHKAGNDNEIVATTNKVVSFEARRNRDNTVPLVDSELLGRTIGVDRKIEKIIETTTNKQKKEKGWD